jgi:hypothetical protein
MIRKSAKRFSLAQTPRVCAEIMHQTKAKTKARGTSAMCHALENSVRVE